MKRASNKSRHRSSSTASIKSLPKDLLIEVVARVASDSFTDLQNMKMGCRDFLEAADDNHVWKQVSFSLDKFPLIQWHPNEKALSFLQRCRECENKESLYREGLQQYFSHANGNGLGSLKNAAQQGHKEARYVYGMILLCSQDDELRKEGLEHMRFLRKSKCIIGCRNNVEQLKITMWINNRLLVPNQEPLCHWKSTCKGWTVKKGRWLLLDDEDDDIDLCEYCRWDHELKYFYELFNVH